MRRVRDQSARSTTNSPMKTSLFPPLAACLVLLSQFAAAQGIPEIKPALVHGFSAEISDFRNGVTAGPGLLFYGMSEHGGRFGFGTLFECNSDGSPTVVVNFGEPGTESRGRNPVGQLIYDGSTYFYGVTGNGGRFGCGTIFRTTAAGAMETLVDLSGAGGAAPGFEPSCGLALGGDGNFYGRLDSGPAQRGSGIFRMSPDGRYQFVVEFPDEDHAHSGFGADPLLTAADGTLIGVLRDGGAEGHGAVFRLNFDGTVTTLVTFIGDEGVTPGAIVGERRRAPRGSSAIGDRINGANPSGQPIEGADGSLYGIGQSRNGTQFGASGFIWKINASGVGSILSEFGFGGPFEPRSPMVFSGSDLLVTCGGGGNNGAGAIFRFVPAGTFTIAANFQGSGETVNGFAQFGIVAQTSNLFLTATDDEIVRVPLPGSVDVITFSSPDKNTNVGASPNSPVLFTAGTTANVQTRVGGANRHGTIVRRPAAGPAAALAALPADFFGSDEEFLALDSSNNLLLVDQFGGDNFNGRILQISPVGNVTMLTSFPENLLRPVKGLASDFSGSTFFGLAFASLGGGNTPDQLAAYSLFGGGISLINPGEFASPIGTSSQSFSGPLVPLGDGNHYLGVLEGERSGGKVFRLGMGGNVTTFSTFAGDVEPAGPLLSEPGGSFVLPAGSRSNENVATILRLSPTGKVTKLGSVSADHAGEHLLAPLARDAQGRIYGVIEKGGNFNGGVLYRTDLDGKTHVLYHFPVDAQPDNPGANPSAGLTYNSTDQAIYGVTEAGGPNGGGTIFKIVTTPDASGTTQTANVQPNSATLLANLTNNSGHNVEYWFTLSTDAPNSLFETEHRFTGGFHGTKLLPLDITGLRGHTDYYVEFVAKIGFGADAIMITGTQTILSTPNGAPNALDDTIIVTSLTEDAPGDVLANDLEAELDGDDLTIVSIDDPPDFGTVTIASDNKSVIYTPGVNFTETTRDSFTYTVSDNYNFVGGPLTSTATVNVLTNIAIAGEYAGLLFDDSGTAASQREGELAPSPDQIAAGFAQLALSKGRKFSARFGIGGRNVSVKGTMAANRGTRITSGRNFAGTLRTTPAGVEARIVFNGRTLVMRAGQAFAAVSGPSVQASDFTMRFTPTEVADPTSSGGLPAGSGFAVIRQGKNARATIAGALPDGTAFSAKSVIDPDGKMPFQARLNKGKAGTLDAELIVDLNAGTIAPAPGTTARWEKPVQLKSKRFPGAFGTRLMPSGRKHTVPAKNTPPFDLAGGIFVATFDRGGLFTPVRSSFTFNGAKAVIVPSSENTALATLVINGKTGLATGTFKPFGKPVKYRGVLIVNDKVVSGFFLGTVDAGSVQMVVQM